MIIKLIKQIIVKLMNNKIMNNSLWNKENKEEINKLNKIWIQNMNKFDDFLLSYQLLKVMRIYGFINYYVAYCYFYIKNIFDFYKSNWFIIIICLSIK